MTTSAASYCLESEVRTYCREFPTVFVRAKDSRVTDSHGREFLDYFSGAGALSYGHNNERLKRRLLEYIEADGITHSLDLATAAKQEFLNRFQSAILRPRDLEYKVQFTGPTGTDAVEAALKLARKVTGRHVVAHFVNSYHGMSLGSLAVTGNLDKRAAAAAPLPFACPLLYDGDLGPGIDTLDAFEALLKNPANGMGVPAAVIVETIQAEGGVRVASDQWLRRLSELGSRYGFVLIVDDIQVGCGRTGTFFSFEPAGLRPDIICLSKSISGYGLPMSLVLIRPELDVWKPGEHTGTFRGHNLAFVTAAEALSYWEEGSFAESIAVKSKLMRSLLEDLAAEMAGAVVTVRGRGLIQGLVFESGDIARVVSRVAFEQGVIAETCGPHGEVLKLIPPLTITPDEIRTGVAVIACAVRAVAGAQHPAGQRQLELPEKTVDAGRAAESQGLVASRGVATATNP